jgi:Uma2 family endonuclease
MRGPQRVSVEEYLNMPESMLPAELAHGILRVAEAPLPQHQAAVGDFYLALEGFVRERQLGNVWLSPLDVILDASRDLVVQPDLLFISNEREHILVDRVRGAPDLVIEILSPRPRIGRLREHLDWFARYGVRECWLFHQFERRLEVLTFGNGEVASRESFDERTVIHSEVLPAFGRTVGSIVRWNQS